MTDKHLLSIYNSARTSQPNLLRQIRKQTLVEYKFTKSAEFTELPKKYKYNQ